MMFLAVLFVTENEMVERPTTLDELDIDWTDVIFGATDASIMGDCSTYASTSSFTQFYMYAIYSEDQPEGAEIQHLSSYYQTAIMLNHGGCL